MKWLHNLLKGFSLTGALFVFQACYGMPLPLYEEGGEAPMSFSIVSRSTGDPVEGVLVKGSWFSRESGMAILGVSGPDGKCSVRIPYRRNLEGPFIQFEDPNGSYAVKDTTLADLRERDILIEMNPSL